MCGAGGPKAIQESVRYLGVKVFSGAAQAGVTDCADLATTCGRYKLVDFSVIQLLG
jgi:hypothetical protein